MSLLHGRSGHYPESELADEVAAKIRANFYRATVEEWKELEKWEMEKEAAQKALFHLRNYGGATVDYQPGGRTVKIQRDKSECDRIRESRNRTEVTAAISELAAGYAVYRANIPDPFDWWEVRAVFKGGDEVPAACLSSPQRGGGKRGECKGMTPGVRRRMLRMFNSLKRELKPFFLTLTYHRGERSAEDAKADLHRFVQRIREKYTNREHPVKWSLAWRYELQENGKPHFHFMLYGWKNEIPREWLKRQWYEVNSEHEEHRKFMFLHRTPEELDTSRIDRIGYVPHELADEQHNGSPVGPFGEGVSKALGAWIEHPRHPERVPHYVSKYMSKEPEEESDEWTGRIWGVRNRKNLPVATWTKQPRRVSWEDAWELQKRLLTEWNDGEAPDYVPNTLYIWTEDPLKWVNEHFP